MFLIFCWMIIALSGSVMQSSNPFANTALTAAIDDDDTTISVVSTEGFAPSGWITIQDERIAYPKKTATSFLSAAGLALARGTNGTDATAHAAGAVARTVESGMLNQSLQYQVATLTDASGVLGFITIPFRFLKLLLSFFTIPVSYFGTDLQIIGYLWAIVAIGILTVLGISLIGGRRV